MTTIIAIAAAYVFYRDSFLWALVITLVVGYFQVSTKSTMNAQLREALASGLPNSIATEAISDRVTLVNMILSFIIYGLGVYAGIVYFS